MMEIEPPVLVVLCPATREIRPPALVVPLPTVMLMLPEVPSVADPVRRVKAPLLPPVVVDPDVNERDPVTPFDPEGAVLMLNAPLDVDRP
jgi:hypothetical protein